MSYKSRENRERIRACLADGMGVTEIVRVTGISRNTVYHHKRKIEAEGEAGVVGETSDVLRGSESLSKDLDTPSEGQRTSSAGMPLRGPESPSKEFSPQDAPEPSPAVFPDSDGDISVDNKRFYEGIRDNPVLPHVDRIRAAQALDRLSARVGPEEDEFSLPSDPEVCARVLAELVELQGPGVSTLVARTLQTRTSE